MSKRKAVTKKCEVSNIVVSVFSEKKQAVQGSQRVLGEIDRLVIEVKTQSSNEEMRSLFTLKTKATAHKKYRG